MSVVFRDFLWIACSISNGILNKVFDDITLAFRLFPKGGGVKYLSVFNNPNFPIGQMFASGFSPGEPLSPTLTQPCKLSSEDCDEFMNFWGEVGPQLTNPPGNLNTALRKFSDSYHRREAADALIDLVIALEALLFKSGVNYEMRYKFKQRGAILLAKEPGDEIDIRDELLEAYDKRSAIVHRGASNIDWNFVRSTYDYTRKALLKFLKMYRKNLHRDHDDMVEKLDIEALKRIDLYMNNL